MKETVDILAVLRGLSVKYTEMGIDSSAELMNNAADEISDLRFENSVLVSQNKFKATQIESLTAEVAQKDGEIAEWKTRYENMAALLRAAGIYVDYGGNIR